METLFTRPVASCCRRLASSATRTPRPAVVLPQPPARGKATAARARRSLNIPPHPSFLNSSKTADGSSQPTEEIIYNPPESAASVYHTPVKFLPSSDPRRRANLAEILAASQPASSSSPSSSSSSSTQPSVESFPMLSKTAPALKPRHHLTKEDIEEMRRLRAEDPATNSVAALARRFDCSQLFVLMCCQAPKEHREKMKAVEEKYKARWGPRRRAAREERARRNVMLYNGEI
ncbi:hypothetical protein VTJ83DRAFT_3560 [Remersonia thermophila]|uniref:Uncharacterized protein n=1 Tax=Remersonia thermophila TaxID=72144 RepID=A0ABR4DF97_9PEZI